MAVISRLIIANAFSLSMLDREVQDVDRFYGGIVCGDIRYPRYPKPYNLGGVLEWLDYADRHLVPVVSCVGHADTAAVLSNMLGREIQHNRASIKLGFDDILFVAQLVGDRLPEGATTLPEGATFEWWMI